jgi:hypothetical protein
LNFKDDTQQVEYLFAGLEVRSMITLNWKGWRIIYTSIEAGRAGGRRSELKLRPIYEGKVSSQEDFLQAANELAHELGDSPALLEVAFASQAGIEKLTRRAPVAEEVFGDTEAQQQVTKKKKRGKRERQAAKERAAGVWHWQPKAFEDVNAWMDDQKPVDEAWDVDDISGLDIDFDVDHLLDVEEDETETK